MRVFNRKDLKFAQASSGVEDFNSFIFCHSEVCLFKKNEETLQDEISLIGREQEESTFWNFFMHIFFGEEEVGQGGRLHLVGELLFF